MNALRPSASDFGLMVWYERENLIRVTLPDEYANHVCGLCGNWNGNVDDDYFPFGTTQRGSYAEIGNSYKVQRDDEEEV